MNKHRVSTTISEKHWGLLKKHSAKLDTQQKALECALESLENDSKRMPVLSPEDQLWMRTGKEMKAVCIIHRDILKALMETANVERVGEVITSLKPAEYLMTWFYQKPLKNCSLREVLEGLLFFIKTGNMIDIINYTDDGNYYTLKIIHSFNVNNSKLFKILIQSLFDAYGARTESEISDSSLFMRIYKNT